MSEVVELVGFAIIGVMVASFFQPIQVVKEYIGLDKIRFGWVFSCAKCFTLWAGVIYFQDIFKAVIVSLLAYFISFLIDLVENWYKS